MTVHKLNLENIARDAVARFAGQAQAFAVKDEIDATPAEIEALKVRFEQAIEQWKSDLVGVIQGPPGFIGIVYDIEQRVPVEIKGVDILAQAINDAQASIDDIGCHWQGTQNTKEDTR